MYYKCVRRCCSAVCLSTPRTHVLRFAMVWWLGLWPAATPVPGPGVARRRAHFFIGQFILIKVKSLVRRNGAKLTTTVYATKNRVSQDVRVNKINMPEWRNW